ncbi:MAG: type IV secretion system protein [Parvularculaceae bacterium]|nr:type IV secretion system protein [Parvularculaceae bacterium]
MSIACPALDDLSDIGALMVSVDCQSAAYVASAYEGLFGTGGGFAQVLAGLLTIYVAFYGYRLITGAGSATAPDLVRRLAMIGIVLALSSNWPAYQTLFVDTVTGGAEDVASMMSTATTGRPASSSSISGEIDVAVEEMTRLATEWSRRTPAQSATEIPTEPATLQRPAGPAGVSAVNMLWLSAILLGVGSAGVIVITKISLAFLLALGPAFLTLAIFPSARGLFEGWLRTIVAGAFVLVFTILATGGALSVIAPIIGAIARDQAAGINDAGAVFTLLIACIVFAMLIRQVISTTARLTAAWRLPFANDAATSSEREVSAPTRSEAPYINERIAGLVASVGRDAAAPAAPRILSVAAPSGAATPFDTSSEGTSTRRATRAYRGFGSSRVRAAGGYR